MKIVEFPSLDEYRSLLQKSEPFISIYEDEDYVFIGPLIKDAESNSCFLCFFNTLKDNNSNLYTRVEKLLNNSSKKKIKDPIYLKILKDSYSELENKLLLIKKSDLSIEKKTIFKYPKCNYCKKHQYKDSFFKEINLDYEFPRSYRSKSINEIIKGNEDIIKGLIDKDTGIGEFLVRDVDAKIVPMYYIKSNICGRDYYSYGRTLDLIHSKYSAIFEMLERHSSMVPHYTGSIKGSYNSLLAEGIPVIPPADFTLPSEEQFKEKRYTLSKYSEEAQYTWQKIYELNSETFHYLPEQYVFFDNQLINVEERFIYETSNGCALGTTKEEALLYGLFEVIERDNFMVHWYNKISPVKLNIEDIDNIEIKRLVDFIEKKGFKVHVLNITMETGIPAIWAMIVDESNGSNVKCYNAAGAHINPEKALEGALVEVVTSVFVYDSILATEHKKNIAQDLKENPGGILDMEGHVFFYAQKENFKYIEFAIENPKEISFKEAFASWFNTSKKQYTLREIISKVKKYHPRIFIANQSTDIINSMDIYCVKVLIPSMLTMTFGHQNRRVNYERILSGPVIAGIKEKPLMESEINLIPHPFP